MKYVKEKVKYVITCIYYIQNMVKKQDVFIKKIVQKKASQEAIASCGFNI